MQDNKPTSSIPGQSQHIISLVAHGTATTRAELAKRMGLAPSTVSLRIAELTELGILVEDGTGASKGGRKPRLLRLEEDRGQILTADLGSRHVRLGRFSLTGKLMSTHSVAVSIESGPEATLTAVQEAWAHISGVAGLDRQGLRGVGIGLPGPVNVGAGTVQLPSRMPAWAGFPIRDWLEDQLGVPVVVDNDANLSALGEHHASLGPNQHSITVKAGTAIGAGIIVGGRLHRGATGAAGDVTHTRVESAKDNPCSCGNMGCLETVASGAGLVRQLQRQGVDVSTTADVLKLVHSAEPLATTALRTAGTHLGEVLATIVNFFNPDSLFLTGRMASSELFIAAVRSRIYEGCHPLMTQKIHIGAATTGPDSGLYGAAYLVLNRILSDLGSTR
ncbi:ROK family transcriptional regulator [Arthrobacter sp. E3]|uniref:ROK family transcriptional regulator n=1 Tax=Arthrobacter sp. E3 TaxID=517402 RepID=UPI001A93CD2D|nr:ROK family transcriptional regulator [Arthrobacter sp. E3]